MDICSRFVSQDCLSQQGAMRIILALSLLILEVILRVRGIGGKAKNRPWDHCRKAAPGSNPNLMPTLDKSSSTWHGGNCLPA